MLPADLVKIDPGAAAASRPVVRDWRTRLPFFPGWLVVASASVCLGFTATAWYSGSVFYVALLEEFGWSRATTAGVFSMFVIVMGLGGASAGLLADRFGPGRVASIGSMILAVALLASSQITELWQFYLFFGLVAPLGSAICGWVPSITIISRWFSARLGTALGLASSGIGVGMLVMVPLTQVVITALGWRAAYMVLAAVMLVVVAPVTWVVMRGRPEDLGLQRDGRRPLAGGEAGQSAGAVARRPRVVDQEWASRTWTVAAAIGTRRFWALFAVLALNNVAVQMIFVHQVAFLADGGYDRLLAASVVGLIGLVSVGAKIIWGSCSDRLGREVTWTMGLILLALSIAMLMMTRVVVFPALLYVFSIVFALGYGATAPLGPAVASDIFAGRRFGSIYGMLAMGSGLGSATGTWFAGYVFDLTGSYLFAFACAVAASLVAILAVWLVAPRKVRRVPGQR